MIAFVAFAILACLAFPSGIFIRRAFERSNIGASFREEFIDWRDVAINAIGNAIDAADLVRMRARAAAASSVRNARKAADGIAFWSGVVVRVVRALPGFIAAEAKREARKAIRSARKAAGKALKDAGKGLATLGQIVDGTRADALRKRKVRAMAKAGETPRKAAPRKARKAA